MMLVPLTKLHGIGYSGAEKSQERTEERNGKSSLGDSLVSTMGLEKIRGKGNGQTLSHVGEKAIQMAHLRE